MADRLKIYACSGIGDNEAKAGSYTYWMDNTNSLTNTQAVNSLLVEINSNLVALQYLKLSKEEQLECLNKIDFLVVCLDAAQNYAKHYTILEKAGKVIQTMYAQDRFYFDSFDNDARDKHLDELLAWFDEAMQTDGQYVISVPELEEWWQNDVISLNKIGLDATQRAAVESALSEASVSGIGKELDWHDNKELNEYLTKAGTYFLYTYFTNAQLLQLPKENRNKIAVKIRYQQQIYNYCYSLFVGVYGNKAAYDQVIRDGIIAEFKDTPENLCADIASGKRSIMGVGSLSVTVILAIISAIVTVVVAAIKAICQAVAKSEAEKWSVAKEKACNEGVPNPEDFDGLDFGKKTSNAGFSGILPLLFVGGAILMLLRKGRK